MLSHLKSKLKEEKKKETQVQPENKTIPFSMKIFHSPLDLKEFEVKGLDKVYYVRDFLDEAEEEALISQIKNSGKERWVSLPYSKRRLQKWGGDVTNEGLDNQEPLPDYYQILADALKSQSIIEKDINHILLNEYEPGIGIMPHTDGPLYFPYVCIISLGSTCTFSFYKDYEGYKQGEVEGKLFIEPRSLLIFSQKCYNEYLHSIPDTNFDPITLSVNENGLVSPYSNILKTSFLKGNREKIDSEISLNGIFDLNVWRQVRYSITLRHVFPKIMK